MVIWSEYFRYSVFEVILNYIHHIELYTSILNYIHLYWTIYSYIELYTAKYSCIEPYIAEYSYIELYTAEYSYFELYTATDWKIQVIFKIEDFFKQLNWVQYSHRPLLMSFIALVRFVYFRSHNRLNGHFRPWLIWWMLL